MESLRNIVDTIVVRIVWVAILISECANAALDCLFHRCDHND